MRDTAIRKAFGAVVRPSTRRIGLSGRSTRVSLPANAPACAFATNSAKIDSDSAKTRRTLAIGIAAGLAGCFTLAQLGRQPLAEAPPRDDDDKDDEDPQTRLFRLDEINHHNRETKGYWVYRGDRVYVEGSLHLWAEIQASQSYACHTVVLDRIVLLAAGSTTNERSVDRL